MSEESLIPADLAELEYGLGGFVVNPAQRLKSANIFYTIVLVAISVFCFCLYNLDGGATIGMFSVARMTALLAIWFAIHALMVIGNPDLEDSWQFNVHTGWLPIHALIFVILCIIAWKIPDPFYDVCLHASIYISALYIALKVIMLMRPFRPPFKSGSDNLEPVYS
jgi:hypothetical protein